MGEAWVAGEYVLVRGPVVSRALSERPWRLRLTSGQRLAILRSPRRPGAARA